MAEAGVADAVEAETAEAADVVVVAAAAGVACGRGSASPRIRKSRTGKSSPVTEVDTGPVRRALDEIWRRLSERLGGEARLVTIRADSGLAAAPGK